MGKIIEVPVIGLSDEPVASYGCIVAIGKFEQPDIQGEGWQCWYPLGELQDDYKLEIGMVAAEPGCLEFNKMEKHPNRSEWVFAIDKPYIQVVALTDTTSNSPDCETIKAFLINPGEGILLKKDVWHAPGIAPFDETSLYGFVLGRAKRIDEDMELGLVEFLDGQSFRCRLD